MIGRSSEFNENKLDSRISIFVMVASHLWLRCETKTESAHLLQCEDIHQEHF
jgi:hypothetical protein